MNRARANKPMAWTVHRKADGGQTICHARINCTSCTNTVDQRLKMPMVPQHVAKRFRAMGWDCEPHAPGSVVCPACKKRPPIAKVISIITKGEVPMNAPALAQSSSIEQRAKIRDLIDKFFDEGKGYYVGDYSDQRIAREVGVPFAAVTGLRETAYGPLRGDPETHALRGDIATLRAKVTEGLDMLSKMDGDASRLLVRVEAVEKRFKP